MRLSDVNVCVKARPHEQTLSGGLCLVSAGHKWFRVIVSKLGSNTDQGDSNTEPPTQCYQVEFADVVRIIYRSIKTSADFNKMTERTPNLSVI